MIELDRLVKAYRKEQYSIDEVFEKILPESPFYDIYYNKYQQYLYFEQNIEDIISSRKNLNRYIRSLSFQEAVKFVYYITNNYPEVRFYRTNHLNDFVLESFGLIKLKDKNLIEYQTSIERIMKLEYFDPPEIDSIGKYSSLPYYALIYNNLDILDLLLERANQYYHSGIAINYYLWEYGLRDRFIDSLAFQSILIPQYSYLSDNQFDLIAMVCLDDILYILPDKILYNILPSYLRDKYLRFSSSEILQKDIADIINDLEQIKYIIAFGRLEFINIFKSTISLLKEVGIDTEELEKF